jgi:hypothetical protein
MSKSLLCQVILPRCVSSSILIVYSKFLITAITSYLQCDVFACIVHANVFNAMTTNLQAMKLGTCWLNHSGFHLVEIGRFCASSFTHHNVPILLIVLFLARTIDCCDI